MEIKTYNFVGIDATQAKGIEEVKEHTGIGIAPCGLTVEVKKEGEGIHLVPADGKIQITYGRDFEFYRALSQLNYVIFALWRICHAMPCIICLRRKK